MDGFVDPSADSAGFGRSKLKDFMEDQEEDRQRGYSEQYSDVSNRFLSSIHD